MERLSHKYNHLFFQAKYFFIAAFLCLALGISVHPRLASAENLYLAGFNGNDDNDYYGYIGAIIPAFGSSLADDGWRFKFWGDYTAFEYDGTLAGGPTGIPTEFEGEGLGIEGSMGYRWSVTPNLNSTTYIGLKWKDIDVEPTDPGSDVEDDNLGVKFQEEIDYQFTNNLDVSLIGSYTAGYDDTYWARLRPGYTFNNGWKLGPEIVLIGAQVFDKQRYGVFLSGLNLGNFGIELSAGHEEEASTNDSAFYGAISLSFVY